MTLEFNDILLYAYANGKVKIEVIYQDETFWLSQKKMAELFDVENHMIAYHLKEIYQSCELIAEATTRKFRVVQREGNREIDFYNLVSGVRACSKSNLIDR
jgi:hypothetical protein